MRVVELARRAAPLIGVLGLASLVATAGAKPGGSSATDCDRACLNDYIDRYLQALVNRDPKQLRWARSVHFTENAVALKPGDGLWATVTGLGTYRLYVDDVPSEQAGVLAVVSENGTPALLSLRLKIVAGQITEAETKVARHGDGQMLATGTLRTAPAVFQESLPETDRPSRAELIKIVDSYFEAIEHNDGGLVPFADDGFRIENGIRTCNNPTPPDVDPAWQHLMAMPCRQGLSSHVFAYIKSIEPRRYEVVDVEHGVVFADSVFNHPGTVLTVDSPELGKFNMMHNAWASHPTSALMTEVFKIKNRQIVQVSAVIVKVPYRMPPGW